MLIIDKLYELLRKFKYFGQLVWIMNIVRSIP